ncbi:MAG: 5-methylthioribose kinase [Algoriphagus sp.]|jgi:5-methylthioribose kinase
MIDLSETSTVETLSNLPIWNSGEKPNKSEIAGESNMNLVLRIATNHRLVILKQSKPYVRKFPQIPAPIDRIMVEKKFYSLMESDPVLSSFSPKVYHYDPENYILLIEDLGKVVDFMEIYSKGFSLSESIIAQLAVYLNALHSLKVSSFPENLEMKRLNHIHIFNFPFEEENGFDLDTIQPGLQALSLTYKRDNKLKKVTQNLGEKYLATGKTLIHGDFYPTSWLQVGKEIRIIDPEFGFMGDPEFDLGVLFAHFKLSRQADSLKSDFLKKYKNSYSEAKINKYEAIEIMRRLIGIAQLPLQLNLSEKEELLESASHQLVNS